ncbi:TPA: hypothetical protein MNI86_005441 [Klebsiella pneumoniae]|uniref:hypothetical protein n=1 Tax=Klebsiella pneumoniae TaxID=573 RepID=UPI0027B8F181|nr:hypothetical protein [Klebsiella pneumoniae]WLX50472.1 hypothetical protein RA207_15135 [Klebsiella pneumoniae]HCA0861292.1 hypothetical protein [Klebsiella pneumoniae]HCQ8110295.1 hypothetical protein [Klebsiella quasipneumoniae subsp. similipneumoniae]
MSERKLVEFQDFVEFLNSFDEKSHVCPFCKSSKWTLRTAAKKNVDNEDVGVTLFLPLGTTSVPPSGLVSGGINFLVMSCNQCGYTNLFDHSFVLQRLNRVSQDKNDVSAETGDGQK